MQSERDTYKSISQTKADIGGAGFAASGSGLGPELGGLVGMAEGEGGGFLGGFGGAA
jgi:hypothetical protein